MAPPATAESASCPAFSLTRPCSAATSSAAARTGIISGTGRLVKQGTGTLTLGGIHTYTGNTEIDAGTLAVTGNIADGSTICIGHGVLAGNATLAQAANGVDLSGPIQVNVDPGTGNPHD